MANAGSGKSRRRSAKPKPSAAAELARLTAEKEASEDRVFALTHRVATLEGRERDLNELIIAHRERVAGLEAERESLGERLADEKRRSAGIEARLGELDQQLTAARDQIAGLEAERDRLTENLEHSDRHAGELRDRHGELNDQVDGHNGRIAGLEGELEEQRERAAEEERRSSELSAQLNRHAERIAALEAEKEMLRGERDAAGREIESLRDRERDAQGRTVILHEQVARLEAQEEMLNRMLAEERSSRSALEQQDARLRPQLETARERVRVLEADQGELRGTLERALVDAKGNQAALREREAELEAARAQISSLESKGNEIAAELETEQQTVTQLRGRESELRQEVTELRERERELTSTIEGVREQVSGLEAQRTNLIGERDRLAAEHDRLRSRLEQLESSRTYRMMRMTWRMRARLRHPFRRAAPRPALSKPKKARPKKAKPSAERPVIASPVPARTPKPKPAEGDQRKLKPMPTPAMRRPAKPVRTAVEPEEAKPAAPEKPPEPEKATEEDLERERWLAKPQAPPADVRELRVAGVLDEMSAACFGPDCDLLLIDSEGWAEALEAHEPHLLLVESAWQGNSGSWQYMVASYTHPDYIGLPNLRRLIAWCRERDIPTVFWNKEDPVHFERFKEAAALFDYIFTSDANCIERYAALEREGAGPISSLQFAAQPRVHNPIGAPVERSPSPVFAGAYYRDRHIDRQKSLEMLLDAAMPFGLEIYDRRFGHEDKAFGFPERFQDRVQGALPYDEMIDAYKAHRTFLNVNSVHDSPTMFSRRVFELLACGTAVVSTESVGVEQTLGDVVSMVETPDQAADALTKLQDDDYWRELTQRARRRVIGEHTYRHRMAEVASVLGFNVTPYAGEEVAALALVDDVEQARRFRAVVSSISAQETRPAELLIGSHTSVAGDLQELQADGNGIRVRVVQQDLEASRSQRYRQLAALAASPWLAILHPAHTYGEHHLTDLVLTTRFADADVIGSASFETTEGSGAVDRSLEHRFVDSVHPHSVLVKRDLIAGRGWPDDATGKSLSDWFREGVRIYSGDAGNFRADVAIGLPGRAAGVGP